MYHGKNVLVIGLGISGRSAAAFLQRQGAHVTAMDAKREAADNPEVVPLRQNGLKVIHESDPCDLSQYHCLVVSPGISHAHPKYAEAKTRNIPIIGEVELACQFIKGTFLAVTGTNGKTTVTLLTAHVLNQAGRRARALGNVGTPLTAECQGDAFDIAVVELSSFQLETMKCKVIDAAVLLNVTPDHLDRYQDMNAYAMAKLRIADCLKPKGELYVEHACLEEFGHLRSEIEAKTYGYQAECDITTDYKHLIAGKKIACVLPSLYQERASHDLENIMASYALCSYVGITPTQFLEGLTTFRKPPHRIEFVRSVNGVSYYDDSKGTNIDAVIRAVQSIPERIVLIAGGVDKGAAYTPWISAFGNKVKCVCAIGQAAQKIKNDLQHALPVELCGNLEKAVAYAANMAKPGEVVLLSPGCSSFDMFRDYAHRGEVFQKIVNKL